MRRTRDPASRLTTSSSGRFPGECGERLRSRKTITVTEPEPDELEVYDLTVDPLEQRNLAHPSFLPMTSHALQATMLGLLAEQLAAKRRAPSAGERPGYVPPVIA